MNKYQQRKMASQVAIEKDDTHLIQCRTCRQHKHHSLFKYKNWDWNLCENCKRIKNNTWKSRARKQAYEEEELDAHLKEMSEFLYLNKSIINIELLLFFLFNEIFT